MTCNFSDLEARVARLETFHDTPDDIPGDDTPPSDSNLSPSLPPTGDNYGDHLFDALAPNAHRWFSGRDQYSIDFHSMGNPKKLRRGDIKFREDLKTNTQVRFDSDLGAAMFNVPAGGNGTDLATDLYLRIDIPPSSLDRWVIIYYTWWSRDWLVANDSAVDGRPWRNSKNIHLRGESSLAPKGDGVLKQNIHFIRKENRQDSNHLLTEFGETRAAYLGSGTTNHNPIKPSNLSMFPVEVETWTKHVIMIEDNRISSYIGDEERPIIVGYRDLGWIVPDGGIHSMQVFLNPKPAMDNNPAARFGFKNMLVVHNPTDDLLNDILED